MKKIIHEFGGLSDQMVLRIVDVGERLSLETIEALDSGDEIRLEVDITQLSLIFQNCVRCNNCGAAKRYLRGGVSPNLRFGDDGVVADVATSVRMFKLLLKYGAQVRLMRSIYARIQRQEFEIVKLMLENGFKLKRRPTLMAIATFDDTTPIRELAICCLNIEVTPRAEAGLSPMRWGLEDLESVIDCESFIVQPESSRDSTPRRAHPSPIRMPSASPRFCRVFTFTLGR